MTRKCDRSPRAAVLGNRLQRASLCLEQLEERAVPTVTYSGFLAGRNPFTIPSGQPSPWSNPSTLFPFSGVNTTSAAMSTSGDWNFRVKTRSEVQNTTISLGNLQEATATIQVNRMGQLSGSGPFPTQQVVTGLLTGTVRVGTNSFHDGSLTFGTFSIGSLDTLFFPDVGVYTVSIPLTTTVAVSPTGSFPINILFSSSSWGRVGITEGDFSNTLQVTSILLPNGQTPESQGFTLTFDDGSVSPNNVPPQAVNDTATTGLNQAVVVNVLSNDSDPDGTLDPTSVAVTQNSASGSVSVNATTGVITYTPNTGFSGSDTFKYTVRDNLGAVSNEATVTVTVQPPPNTPPVAANDTATTPFNTAAVVNVLSNDSDPDGTLDPTTVAVMLVPASGTLAVNPTTGTITYTPNTGFSGSDTFKYTEIGRAHV